MKTVLISTLLFVLFLMGLSGLIGVVSKDHQGNNWGKSHMKDLGLDDYKDDNDLKPF